MGGFGRIPAGERKLEVMKRILAWAGVFVIAALFVFIDRSCGLRGGSGSDRGGFGLSCPVSGDPLRLHVVLPDDRKTAGKTRRRTENEEIFPCSGVFLRRFFGRTLCRREPDGVWGRGDLDGKRGRRLELPAENGSMAQNSFEDIDGEWYYFDADGNMVSGWRKISNQMYHFEEDGRLTEAGNVSEREKTAGGIIMTKRERGHRGGLKIMGAGIGSRRMGS